MLLTADQGPPRFPAAAPIIANALAELRFPERVPVSIAADRHRILDNPGAYAGPWRDSPHPVGFMKRAMDALNAESPWAVVAVMGPAQTGKSEIGNNWQLHTVLYDPADMLFVMPDRVAIDEYVKTQWNKMLELIPELRGRQLDGSSADAIHLKQFRGCSFFFRWPTGPTFRAKPIQRGRLDDFDDIPQDIGAAAEGKDGQGDALSLMLGRAGSFDAYGGMKVYVNSTPKLGKRRGIEAIVASGTDERWHVDCLQCGSPFALDTEACLKFEQAGTPAEAAASAAVVCGECGGYHRQQDKAALMSGGRWVGRGETAVSFAHNPEGKAGTMVVTDRLTQRWDGLMGFRRWSSMAQQAREAELALELQQDEGPLKVYVQTWIGKNYVSRSAAEEGATEEALAKRAREAPHRFGEFPPEARCLIMAVDQAINRFEVAAWAFGPGFRAWLVDRFSIVNCGDEPLQPFTRAEHFAVLHPRVLSKRYLVRGTRDHWVKPLNTVVDTGGMDSATDNAFAWWHSMVTGDVGSGRAKIPHTAITLFKGGNKATGKLLPPPLIDAKRQIKGAPQCELFMPNVNRLKSMADVGLGRTDGGPGSIVFPGDVDRHGELVVAPYIAEMKAEAKNAAGLWERPPNTPNETLDTYTMARAALLRLGGNDHSLDWVPGWARPPRIAPAPAEDPAPAAAALREAQGREEPEPAPARPSSGVVAAALRRRGAQTRPRVRVISQR